MGRDLSIWKRLVVLGFDAEHLNGAISVVRTVAPQMDGPRRMTVFYNGNPETDPTAQVAERYVYDASGYRILRYPEAGHNRPGC